MEGSSTQRSKSKKKLRPVGPIEIYRDGKPFGPYYDALSDAITRHVTHCDEFSPIVTWPEHKNTGRVERLYRELTPIFSLPEWTEPQKVSREFRKWFNDTARHRFNDRKWRSLQRTFKRCGGNISEAIKHVPERVDPETWAGLCAAYVKNEEDDGSGTSKKEKRKASRKVNDLDHRLGRDALSVWSGKFRAARGRSPNAPEIYQKEFRKCDALNAVEGELPHPDPRGKALKDIANDTGVLLQQRYDAAIADGSDESTASTRAAFETFGRVTRLGLQAPRDTRPSRRDAYTSQLQQEIQTMREDRDADRARIAQLEQSQSEMLRFMAEFRASSQSGGQSTMAPVHGDGGSDDGGGGDDDDGGGDDGGGGDGDYGGGDYDDYDDDDDGDDDDGGDYDDYGDGDDYGDDYDDDT